MTHRLTIDSASGKTPDIRPNGPRRLARMGLLLLAFATLPAFGYAATKSPWTPAIKEGLWAPQLVK